MPETITTLPLPPPMSSEKPFIIALERRDPSLSGSFTPGASLKVTPTLRTSGLLKALQPEGVAWLLFMLTFLTANGHLQAHLDLLAEAMHVSKQKAMKRMEHLTSFLWQEQPLVNITHHDSGLISYSLSPHVIAYEHEPPPSAAPSSRLGGFRDEIIAHSRAMYSRPRAEVERMIDEQYGWSAPEPNDAPELTDLKRQLENVGINSEQAGNLLSRYEQERIERQLDWLPYRGAKNPAGFLIAAIEEDYAEPLSLRTFGEAPATDDQALNPPAYE